MNIRQCRGNSLCVTTGSFPTSCPFRKPYFLPWGCSCPRPTGAALAQPRREPVCNEDAERLRAERKVKRRARYLANRERDLLRAKAYQEANKEQRNAYQKAHYLANREKILARAKAYKAANREKLLAYSAAYWVAHKEQLKAAFKAYHAANRERRVAAMAARRAARKQPR